MSVIIHEPDAKNALLRVINELAADRIADVLEFALFVQARQAQPWPNYFVKPVRHLEDLWGDFWPADEPVDDFIDAVRRWRREDIMLHKDI
jgi:hypothetical protein